MATVDDDLDDAETLAAENLRILADFDAEHALQRLEVEPRDLTSYDRDTAAERAALLERLRAIDAEYLAEVGAADEADDDEPAAFSTPEVPFDLAQFCGESGDCAEYKGTIFRAGDYTRSHGFSMSRDELARVVRDFRPVPITHGHAPHRGPLDELGLGEVRSVELSPDGDDLIGRVALPRWLRDRLGKARLRVSASFDRLTKRLRDVSLVSSPTIPDAELFAAFAAAREPGTVTRDFTIYRVGDASSGGVGVTKAELARTLGRIRLPMATWGGPYRATLSGVSLAEGGTALVGTLTMPAATDDALARMKLRLRAEFDEATKVLTGLQLYEQARPTAVIDSPATFSTRRIAMGHETDAQFAKRICATHLGRHRNLPASRGPGPPPRSRPASAEFVAETDADFAARVCASHNGKNRIAEFATATAPSAPAAPPAFEPPRWIQAPPRRRPRRTPNSRRLRPLAATAVESIRTALSGIEAHLRRAPQGPAGGFWTLGLRVHVERIAVLEALLAAIESGEPYQAPSPADLLRRQGSALVELALGSGKHTPEDLVAGLLGRLDLARSKAAEATELVAGLLLAFARDRGDVETLRAPFALREREASSWRLERDALEATAAGLGPALGAAVARVIEAAGGEAQVARDLADARTIAQAPATADPDLEELAAVDGQLKALGADAAGRAAEGLRARHDELSATLERRRAAARDRARAEAASIVAGAGAGRMSAWRKLVDAAKGRPSAFANGLGRDLERAPLEAFGEAGWAGFAGVIL